MSYSHRGVAGQFVAQPQTATAISARALRAAPPVSAKPLRAMPMTRRYEASWLGAEGEIVESTRLAPATPLFEEAFSALARGSVVQTTEGPVAVEDLIPGQRVLTAEGRAETITWIGSMVLYPRASQGEEEGVTLTRITADSFGHGKPMPDLVLGPRARLCLRDPRLRAAVGLEAAYAPARAFIDGVSVIEVTPVAPVTMYHLVLERHGSLKVAGMEVESYHPGEGVERMIDPRMLSLFEAQFPQVERLSGFGPLAHPRLTRFEVENLWE